MVLQGRKIKVKKKSSHIHNATLLVTLDGVSADCDQEYVAF